MSMMRSNKTLQDLSSFLVGMQKCTFINPKSISLIPYPVISMLSNVYFNFENSAANVV